MVVAPQTPGDDKTSRRDAADGRRARLAAANHAAQFSRTYSRLVGVLKYVLPVAGLVIVALVVLWPELHHVQVDISSPTERPTAGANGEIQNPRYSGVDEASRPYTVWATVAKQMAGCTHCFATSIATLAMSRNRASVRIFSTP